MYFSFPKTPDKLTATEQAIIEYITGHRDEFLFMTIGQLSAALTVSEATISRFARHVGCCDFKHLKRIIMEQTVQKRPCSEAGQHASDRKRRFSDILDGTAAI